MSAQGPIGVFDSGYGGLTILHEIRRVLPKYDYLYLGDNARSPYGNRSYELVYRYTSQAVMELFRRGCHLVVLGCNTASAKALRTLQMDLLPKVAPERRVLGVIRPTTEMVGSVTRSRHIGILATEGTVRSGSYEIEIAKFFPDIKVSSQECPLWAAIVEAGEADSEGADFFVRKRIEQLIERDPEIDTIVLGCTHYPLLIDKIEKHCRSLSPSNPITILSQGTLVAQALKDYLHRHSEMAEKCTMGGTTRYLTTESATRFVESAHTFLDEDICAEHISLD